MEPISEFDRSSYQRAARTILRHPLITSTFPDPTALSQVRRWIGPLSHDLLDLFGYRLELTATTARLIRLVDELDESRPARTRADRVFDRRRYAYLALVLAVLDRAGTQVALSELADRVAGEASRIDGLELSAERAADRAAFVDAVGWLQDRGGLRLADGSARGWADNPDAGEALYDIDRDVIRAVYRPSRVLQHVDSVTELLSRATAVSRDTIRREAAQRVHRALVEDPVVYYDALDPVLRGMLRSPGAADDVAALTGAAVERRAEGVALLDVASSFSDRRFPGPGTVTQVALLLTNAISDRIVDVDAPPLARFPLPEPASVALTGALDAALPQAGVFHVDGPNPGPDRSAGTAIHGRRWADDGDRTGSAGAESETPEGTRSPDGTEAPEDAGWPDNETETPANATALYPLLERGWLQETVQELMRVYGSTFAARWMADPEGLLDEAQLLLVELGMLIPTSGGVLALPLLARYRNAEVRIAQRTGPASDSGHSVRDRDAGLFAV